MRAAVIAVLLQFVLLVAAEEAQSKDLVSEDPEELERGHRHRRRKQQQQQLQAAGPCGGYGRTFGEKLFGWSAPGYSNTYVSAPVMNYFIGCGSPAAPAAPAFPFPYQQPNFGPHQHSHSHSHAHSGGFGGPAYQQSFPFQGGYNQPSFDQYQPYSQRPGRPVQTVVSAAASGLGTALADYISGASRPKKTRKQLSNTVNQLIKPLYNTLDGYGAYQSRDLILGPLPLDGKGHEPDESKASAAAQDHPHQVKHPTSYMETMLHIFKGNIGSGLLAMGDAFKNGGLVFAPIMMAVLGVVSVHAQHLLLNCSEAMHRQSKRDKPPNFSSTVSLVFQCGPPRLRPLAPVMKLLVDLFLCVTQLGFCCVYIVFISNNIKLICDEYGFELELSVHMILVVVPILLSCMVRNLKYLTPFSTAANVMMFIGVGAVVYEASQDLPPVRSRAYLGPWTQLPLFLGTAIYAFEGIGLVLPLKSEMRKPEQFQRPLGVLNVGMVIVGGIFITVGFLGYLKWGEDVLGSLTLNLQPGTIRGKAAQLLIALAMLLTYPLQMYVPVVITWPALRKRFAFRSPVLAELAYRFALVFLTFVLAESIPQLGLFISLVGAVSSTALALVFPPLLQLVLTSQQPGGVPVAVAIKDGAIMLLGGFIFVTGTFQSIAEIVKAFREPA